MTQGEYYSYGNCAESILGDLMLGVVVFIMASLKNEDKQSNRNLDELKEYKSKGIRSLTFSLSGRCAVFESESIKPDRNRIALDASTLSGKRNFITHIYCDCVTVGLGYSDRDYQKPT